MVHELEPLLVQSLLDRLDPRLDEPCNVPGCTHLGHADGRTSWSLEQPVAA